MARPIVEEHVVASVAEHDGSGPSTMETLGLPFS